MLRIFALTILLLISCITFSQVTCQDEFYDTEPNAAFESPGEDFISVDYANFTRDVVLLIDHSASMNRTDPEGIRMLSIQMLRRALTDCDHVDVAIFNDVVDRLIDGEYLPTFSSIDNVLSEMSSIQYVADRECNQREARLYTNINKALKWAGDILNNSKKQSRRQHIILLTDGEMDLDNVPGFSDEDNDAMNQSLDLFKQPRLSDVNVHVVGFSSGLGEKHGDAREFLRKLSTDGKLYYSPDQVDLLKVFHDCLGDVKLDRIPTETKRDSIEFNVDDSIKSLRLFLHSPYIKGDMHHWNEIKSKWDLVKKEEAHQEKNFISLTNPEPGKWRVPEKSSIDFDGMHFVFTGFPGKTAELGYRMGFKAELVVCDKNGDFVPPPGIEKKRLDAEITLVDDQGKISTFEMTESSPGVFVSEISLDNEGKYKCTASLTDNEYLNRVTKEVTFEIVKPDEKVILSKGETIEGKSVDIIIKPLRESTNNSYHVELIDPRGDTVQSENLVFTEDEWRGQLIPVTKGKHEVRITKKNAAGKDLGISSLNRSRKLNVLPLKFMFQYPRSGMYNINTGSNLKHSEYRQSGWLKRWWSQIITFTPWFNPPSEYSLPFELKYSKGAISEISLADGENPFPHDMSYEIAGFDKSGDFTICNLNVILGLNDKTWQSGIYDWHVLTDNTSLAGNSPTIKIRCFQKSFWTLIVLPVIIIALFIWLLMNLFYSFSPVFVKYCYSLNADDKRENWFKMSRIRRIELSAEDSILVRDPRHRSYQRVNIPSYQGAPVNIVCMSEPGKARLIPTLGEEVEYRESTGGNWKIAKKSTVVRTTNLDIRLPISDEKHYEFSLRKFVIMK